MPVAAAFFCSVHIARSKLEYFYALLKTLLLSMPLLEVCTTAAKYLTYLTEKIASAFVPASTFALLLQPGGLSSNRLGEGRGHLLHCHDAKAFPSRCQAASLVLAAWAHCFRDRDERFPSTPGPAR